jgi:hypothetical protein
MLLWNDTNNLFLFLWRCVSDKRITWHKHIFTKWKQLGITLTKMYWLLGCKSKLSTSNKLCKCKTVLKPIWTYGIQLLGTASTSNIEILERFQLKALCMIVDAPWYIPNKVIRRDQETPAVKKINPPLHLSIQCSPQRTSKGHISEPHGFTRQQVIVKTPAQIASVIVVSVLLVFKV